MPRAGKRTATTREVKVLVAMPDAGLTKADLEKVRKAFQNALVTTLERSTKADKEKMKAKTKTKVEELVLK